MNLICLITGHRWQGQRCQRCDAWRNPTIGAKAEGRAVHHLQIWPEYFADVVMHQKRFEVRKADRSFALGDRILLREWDPIEQQYTGHGTMCTITYLLQGGKHGIEAGHVVIGFKINSFMHDFNTPFTQLM